MAVNSFAWLRPWTENVIAKIHYIQIDGSFLAFPEYALCIWHAILYKQLFPFTFSKQKDSFEKSDSWGAFQSLQVTRKLE